MRTISSSSPRRGPTLAVSAAVWGKERHVAARDIAEEAKVGVALVDLSHEYDTVRYGTILAAPYHVYITFDLHVQQCVYISCLRRGINLAFQPYC